MFKSKQGRGDYVKYERKNSYNKLSNSHAQLTRLNSLGLSDTKGLINESNVELMHNNGEDFF